jgi:serine/threonine protein kinase
LRPGCGTLEYCAPEILGVVPKNVTPSPSAADIYAFACLAFELLTATMLFDADDEMALVSMQLSHDGWPSRLTELASHAELAELAVILAACLRRDPRQRPTATEMRSALSAINHRLSPLAWPMSA